MAAANCGRHRSLVDVLQPQQQAPADPARHRLVEQRRIGMAEMQVTVGRGGESKGRDAGHVSRDATSGVCRIGARSIGDARRPGNRFADARPAAPRRMIRRRDPYPGRPRRGPDRARDGSIPHVIAHLLEVGGPPPLRRRAAELRRARRHRHGPAALDRERRGDPGAPVGAGRPARRGRSGPRRRRPAARVRICRPRKPAPCATSPTLSRPACPEFRRAGHRCRPKRPRRGSSR